MTRVLTFTCSRLRPLMLRHSALQMMSQTYPVDYSVFINSDDPADRRTDFTGLLSDLVEQYERKIILGFGKTGHQHQNFLAAVRQAELDKYDLFLKIDDDDVYRLHYVEDVVADFERIRWDLSGESAQGIIVGHNWLREESIANLGVGSGRKCCGLPSTWGFSRAAIDAILGLQPEFRFEGQTWKRHIEDNTNLVMHRRSGHRHNYHYYIHGDNLVGNLERYSARYSVKVCKADHGET